MKYEKLINQIIDGVGGEDNIQSVTHCMTRLRFVLKDDSKGNTKQVSALPEVVDSVQKGGQFQVIIGTHVSDVYSELIKKYKLDEEQDDEKNSENKSFLNNLLDTISGIFIPIVGALAGSGMIKAILAVLVNFDLINTESQTYTILFMISDVVFYFLPILLAITASKKFNTNTFLSVIFAAMLVHPTLIGLKEAGEAVQFLGINMTIPTYSSSVVPILLIVFLQSYVEKFAKKISPKAIQVFFVPLVIILITAPIGLIVLGPIGAIFGEYLAVFFTFLDTKVSWLVPTLVGAFAPLFIMTGMHYSLGAAQSVQRATLGYTTILTPGFISSNTAQAAAVFAIALKTKSTKLKALATSCATTAFCGVTEPALYGVTLKLKTPLYATMIAGGLGGLYGGLTGVRAWSAGTSTVFALPIYLGPDNSFVNAIVVVLISAISGFLISFFTYKDDSEQLKEENSTNETNQEEKQEMANKFQVMSPLKGKKISLTEVNDDAFKTGALGKGVAIIPEEGILTSPVKGKVTMLFETKHAIGIVTSDGLEVLMHIGIDTVKLNGNHFESHVKVNDEVTIGQKLITFDTNAIKKEGYDLTTPIIITNSNDYLDVVDTSETTLKREQLLLNIFK